MGVRGEISERRHIVVCEAGSTVKDYEWRLGRGRLGEGAVELIVGLKCLVPNIEGYKSF